MKNKLKLTIAALFILVTSLIIITCDTSPVAPEEKQIYYPKVTTSRNYWRASSKPAQLSEEFDRSKLYWHNPFDLVPVDEIYDRETFTGESVISTFRLIFEPNESSNSWGGITSYFHYEIFEETEYLEIIAKGMHGKMHLDFGLISVDIDGDNISDDEDINRNGIVDEFEDVGLDGLADVDEPGYDPLTNPDPSGDNWYFMGAGKCPLPKCDTINWDDPNHPLFYKYLNGTEGNISDASVSGRPDREDIWVKSFNTTNVYFSYLIDLEDSEFYVDSLTKNGWNRYRIPFRDSLAYAAVVDNWQTPQWYSAQYVRIWFEGTPGQTQSDTVEIAEIYFEQDGISREDSLPTPDEDIDIYRDNYYAQRRIFDLALPGELLPGDQIINLNIYESVSSSAIIDTTQPLTNFWVDPFDTLKYAAENIVHAQTLRVKQMAQDQFEFYSIPDSNKHYVYFKSNRQKLYHLGCYMEVLRGNDTIRFGNIVDTILQLKLLAPKYNRAKPTDATWQLMWRNCYYVPRGIALADIRIDIFKGVDGSEVWYSNPDYQVDGEIETKYIELLGLDQYNQMGEKIPDGLVDDRIEIFRPDWGLMIFPHRTPFDTDTVFVDAHGVETPELIDKLPSIYNYESYYDKYDSSIYYIQIDLSPSD